MDNKSEYKAKGRAPSYLDKNKTTKNSYTGVNPSSLALKLFITKEMLSKISIQLSNELLHTSIQDFTPSYDLISLFLRVPPNQYVMPS